MNDEDLLGLMEAMAGKIERLDTQLQTIHAALETLTEIGLLTFAATGTEDTLPEEVTSAPIAERAARRNPDRIRGSGITPAAPERHAATPRDSAQEIEARRLAALLRSGDAREIAAEPALADAAAALTLGVRYFEGAAERSGEHHGVAPATAQFREMLASAIERGEPVALRPEFQAQLAPLRQEQSLGSCRNEGLAQSWAQEITQRAKQEIDRDR